VELKENRTDEDGRPIRYAKVTKQKDAEAGKTWPFVLRSVELGMDAHGKAITSCVCVPPKEDIDAVGTADAGYNATDLDRQFLKCILDAIKEHGQLPPPDVECPSRVTRAVNALKAKKLFKASYAGGLDGTEEAKEATLRQRWKRAHDRMVQNSIIGSHENGLRNSWLWFTGKPVRGMHVATASTPLLTDGQLSHLDEEDLSAFSM